MHQSDTHKKVKIKRVSVQTEQVILHSAAQMVEGQLSRWWYVMNHTYFQKHSPKMGFGQLQTQRAHAQCSLKILQRHLDNIKDNFVSALILL